MLRRPKPEDTEEDILAMQEEFMKSGSLPSANLTKTGANKKSVHRAPMSRVECTAATARTAVNKSEKKSHFKMQQESKNKMKQSEPLSTSSNCETGLNSRVVSLTVKERDVVALDLPHFPGLTKYAKDGFPSSVAVPKEKLFAKTNRFHPKKSIFAQMLDSSTNETFGIKEAPPSQGISSDSKSSGNTLSQSTLLTGDGLVCGSVSKDEALFELQRIHDENVHYLAGLSQEEILEEQVRIKELLGSKASIFTKTKEGMTVNKKDRQPLDLSADDGCTS